MLILEGADLVGKTTLQRELLTWLPEYVPAHYTKLSHYHDRFHHYLRAANPYAIQDRFHLSEIAYANVRGDSTPLSQWLDILHSRLKYEYGAYVVLLIAKDNDLFKKRWRQDEMYSLRDVERANGEFKKLEDYADMIFVVDGKKPPSLQWVIKGYKKWLYNLAQIRNGPYSQDSRLSLPSCLTVPAQESGRLRATKTTCEWSL